MYKNDKASYFRDNLPYFSLWNTNNLYILCWFILYLLTCVQLIVYAINKRDLIIQLKKMTLSKSLISKGFIISGLMNASVLVFSRFFTNAVIPEYDADVMSNFGLLMILVWGLAYISVAKNYDKVKWLIGVFAIEKLIYGCIWIYWIANTNLSEVFQKDTMAGLFYSIYGINDWFFCIFFFYVYFRLMKLKN